MTLYLVRHTETLWNREARYQGHGDSPLTLRGIAQAEAIAEALGREPVDWSRAPVFASPLHRVRQTVAIIAEHLGFDYTAVHFDGRLKERAYGAWEGLTQGEIQQRHPAQWRAHHRAPWNYAPPAGGESFSDVWQRVEGWYAEQPRDDPMLVVCHGGTGRVLRGIHSGLGITETLSQETAQNHVFRLEEGGVVSMEVGEKTARH